MAFATILGPRLSEGTCKMSRRLLGSAAWPRGYAAMPYGPEDYGQLSQVFLKKATGTDLAFGVGLFSAVLVIMTQMRTNLQLGKMSEELRGAVDQKIERALKEQRAWLQANLVRK